MQDIYGSGSVYSPDGIVSSSSLKRDEIDTAYTCPDSREARESSGRGQFIMSFASGTNNES